MEEKIATLIELLLERGCISSTYKEMGNSDIVEKIIEEMKTGKSELLLPDLYIFSTLSKIFNMQGVSEENFIKILSVLKEIFEYDYATIFYEKENELQPIAFSGKILNLGGEFSIGGGKGIVGWLYEHKKSIYFNDLELTSERDYHSFWASPLIVENKVCGVLVIAKKEKNAFSIKIQALLDIVSSVIASTLEKLRYIDKIEEQNKQLNDMLIKIEKDTEKLIKAEKLATVSQLFISLNHEINNYLAVINGSLFFIEKICIKDENESAKKHLDRIKGSIDSITSLLRNLEKIKKEYNIKSYLNELVMIDLGNNDEK